MNAQQRKAYYSEVRTLSGKTWDPGTSCVGILFPKYLRTLRDCRSDLSLPIKSYHFPHEGKSFRRKNIPPEHLYSLLLLSSWLITRVKSQDNSVWDRLGLRKEEQTIPKMNRKDVLTGASMLESGSTHGSGL